MSFAARLMIHNGTPFPMTWAHLDREGARDAPQNVLDRTLAHQTGQLVEDVEPGRVRVVCAFEPDASIDHAPRAASRYLDLGPDDAVMVWVVYDRRRGFSFASRDARLPEGERVEVAGRRRRFWWEGKPTVRSER